METKPAGQLSAVGGLSLATLAKKSSSFPAFADSQNLRLFLGTLLYLAQGFPQGVVFYAIPSWLAVNGQSAAVVGAAAAAASLPWAAKWAVGAFMDRYTYLPMGRRRPWLVASQCGIALAFLTYALVSPSPSATTLVIGFNLVISSLTAVQDVALDALVIDLTPDEEKGRLNGFMFGGKLFGIAGGTAITAYFMENFGIGTAMFAMLALFAIPALAAILIRERAGERLLPWTEGSVSEAARAVKPDAWWPILHLSITSLLRRDTLLVIGMLVTYGIFQTLNDQGAALFAARQLGWGESAFGSLLATGNILTGVLPVLIGGWMVDRYGPRKLAIVSASLSLLTIGGFALAKGLWSSAPFYMAWYIASNLAATLFYLCFLVMAMRVGVAKVAATSFALIVATQALGISMGGALLGPLDNAGGFTAIFGSAAVVVFIASLFTLGMSAKSAGKLGVDHETRRVLTTD